MKPWAWLAALLLLPAPALHAGELAGEATPEALCALMKPLGLSSPPVRAEGGGWRCTTARKALPQGEPAGASDLRYRVFGDGRGGRRLVLELRMNSWRGPQGVLQRYYRYLEGMLERLELRPPAGLRRAVLSAAPGEWILAGHRLTLEKRFSKGPVYELWFIVERLP